MARLLRLLPTRTLPPPSTAQSHISAIVNPHPSSSPSAQPVATQTIITSSTTAAPAAGEETQAAVSATLPTLSGGLESVVGDPKGVAPELIASAVREDSQSSQPWYKRISGKRRASVGSRQSVGSGVGDAEGDGEESVGGASLGSEGVSAETSESSVGEPRGDRDGTTPGPTQLVGDQDSDDTPTLAPSVKDKVVSEHSPDPQTSNERFHALFPQLPEEDELIEGGGLYFLLPWLLVVSDMLPLLLARLYRGVEA